MCIRDRGGAASRATAIDNIQVKHGGAVRLHNLKTVTRESGELVAVSRSGEIAIADQYGRERERYKLPYGAVISVGEGEQVEAGQVISQWDPHTHPIVAEVDGVIEFVEMEDGADAAIEALNGFELKGRALRVNEAQSKERSGGGGGGRRY